MTFHATSDELILKIGAVRQPQAIEKSLFRCSKPERPSNVIGLINLSLLSNFVAPNHMVPVVSVLRVLSGTARL